ncbi:MULTISPECIES: hypothetical protein [unclassified Streptomyces]|uniref:hypothetical protein n=1 Tax=unclassified Streptomyces TaxID=2593676 RepID=UPI000CD51CE5|nr:MULTISPECIES: hypothetical protein [unclassified Streptomyces]AWL40156.1 hypothetical protein B9S64_20290 [Streptomyces sp. SM18]
MSQPVQPPNPPQQPYGGGQPTDGNPYAQQPGGPNPPQPGAPYPPQPAAPTGNPFAQQPGAQPGQFGGAPFQPAPPARTNIGLGVAAALGAAIVAAILYGVIAGSIEREIGYAAVGVGFLVGFVGSKVGGSNPAVIGAGVVFSLVAVFFGQLIGMSMIVADALHVSFSEIFFDRFGALLDVWKEEADFMTYLFLLLGPVAAFGGARKAVG